MTLAGRAMDTASAAESRVMRFAAAVVDTVSQAPAAMRLRTAFAAYQLDDRPSAGEWAAAWAVALLALATPVAALLSVRWLNSDFAGAAPFALTIVVAALLVVAEAAVRAVRAHAGDRAQSYRMLIRAARRMARMSVHDGARPESAPERAARLMAAADYLGLQAGALRHAALELPVAAVALTAMLVIGGWLALAPVAIVLAAVAIVALRGVDLGDLASESAARDARSDDFVAECAREIRTLRAAAMEPFMTRRMEHLLKSGRDMAVRMARSVERADDLAPLAQAAAVFAVVAIGGVLAAFGATDAAALAACALLAGNVVGPVTMAAAAAQRSAMLERPADAAPESGPAAAPVERGALAVDVAIHGAAQRVTFEAPYGSVIAVTSRDGARMSALLRVIAGIDAPRAGMVTFAGAPVRALRAECADRFALVGARPTLFSGTVLDNLTLFGRGCAEADARAACDLLGLRSEIDRLPRGLDTRVGDRAEGAIGASLMQRIAIARAMALGPRVLLLDEPQALMAPGEDRVLANAIAALRGRITIIMATSRPSLLTLADAAWSLDQDVIPIHRRAGGAQLAPGAA